MPDICEIPVEQLDVEIEKEYADVMAGRGKPTHTVFTDLRKGVASDSSSFAMS